MNHLFEMFQQFLASNQFAAGGFVMMVLGSIGAFCWRVVPIIFDFLKRKLIVTIDITSQTEVFYWFNEWLSAQDYSKRTRLLTVRSKNRNKTNEDDNEINPKPQLIFSPAPGLHVFWFKNRLVWIHRDREKVNQNQGAFSLYESFFITMLGRNKEVAMDMIKEARDYVYNLEKNQVLIYSNGSYGSWKRIHSQSPRQLNTVILKNNIQYEILNDIKKFFEKEDWYNKLGIPYRRGYLLSGPPGTGKTSLIKALAGELHLPIYILNISKDLKESDFLSLITDVPQKSVILIEDIDSIFQKRNKVEKTQDISFKTMLNAIDGIISPYGTLLFMTTNHREKLDKALIRPGRIDREYFIGKADKKQAGDLFQLFYPDSNELMEQFIIKIDDDKYTPAELQKYFIARPDVKSVVKEITKIKAK